MPENTPKVSVVMPTYNGEKYIRQAIASCLGQTYENLELIVVDGGSQDNTLNIVAGYCDPRLVLVHQPGNRGRLPGAINLGLAQAHGEYLTWTSDDNTYDPEAIAIMAGFLQAHSDVDWVYSGYRRIDEQGRILTQVPAEPPEKCLPQGCNSPCFLFRRRVYEELGGQDLGLPLAADYEYWLRAWKFGLTMQPLKHSLYAYRVHANSLTGREGFSRFLRDTERAMARWIGPNPYRYPSRYARLVAESHVAFAFESARVGNPGVVPSHLFRALLFDPRWITRKGVLSLLFKSLAGIACKVKTVSG